MSKLRELCEKVIEAGDAENKGGHKEAERFETVACESAEKLAKACLLLMEAMERQKQIWHAPHGCLSECRQTCEALTKANALFDGSDGGEK